MINGNKLVEALILPRHDERVLDLLRELGLKRLVKDENYNGVTIIMENPSGEEKLEIDFDEDRETGKQQQNAYGNIYFLLPPYNNKRKYTLEINKD